MTASKQQPAELIDVRDNAYAALLLKNVVKFVCEKSCGHGCAYEQIGMITGRCADILLGTVISCDLERETPN